MYQRRRPVSHLDEFFKIVFYNLFGMLISVALLALGLPDFVYHRPLILITVMINIVLMTVLRAIHAQVQWLAQARGVGDDRVLVVGTGEVGQMLMQKILQNRKLGYHVMGSWALSTAVRMCAIKRFWACLSWERWSIFLPSSNTLALTRL
jgi:FlaA1/EpsC-like NDP-sugar epimerase